MKKKIIAMLTATMCLASNSLCFSSVAIAANTQGDVEIADVKAPSSETQKSLITVDDILGLSKKAEALTWSDFEKYEHTDVGSGLIVWEFNIKDDSSKLLIGGGSLEEEPVYIRLKMNNGTMLDVRKDDLKPWYYDNSTSTATTAPIATTSISTTTTVSNEPVPIETEPAGHYESQYEIIIDDMPDKLVYSIGENLDLTGLRVSLFLYDQQGKKNVVYQNVDPLEYTDVFIIDTNFNNDKAGIYSIGIMTTDHYRAFLETKMQKFTVTVKNQVDMMGDVNDDGSFNVSDVVLLQKWLLAVPDTHLANWKAADFCEDNKLDVFDWCLMKRALIEQRISEGQPVLYCEGEKIGESDEKGWYSTEYSNVITDKQLKDNPDILSRLDKVNAKADELKSTQMIDWKWGVEDYGEDYLYLPYVDENGNADRILLCKFGWDCAWLDDADVQMLVSMLIGNGYYADKTLFEYYIEDQ